MKQWYTVHTKPNSEYQAASALQGRGIETYLPELETYDDRKSRNKKPFFPCYLFVRVDFEATSLSQMQWTPGLRRVVAFDGRPAPLADNVIKLMRRKLDGASGEFAHDFQPGDTVNITDGPLEGIMAIFEGPSTPTERVRVLLSFLGRTSRAYVPVFDLEKVAPRGDSSALKRPRRTRGRGRRIRHSQHPDYAAHRPNG